MLDTAESVFRALASKLAEQNMQLVQAFGGEDMIHVLPDFEGETNVAVMTCDDFMTRCYQLGVHELDQLQQACVVRVLGKPQLGNAIRLNELEIVMMNFMPGTHTEHQVADS